MYRITHLALATLVAAVVFTAAPVASFAQGSQDQKKITLDMQQADVREVLRALFKGVDLSYSVAPEVQGLITVSLKEVPFETALQNVLRQINATYRIVGGVYEIVLRETEVKSPDPALPPIDTKKQTEMRRIYLRSVDPMLLSLLMSKSGTDFNMAPEQSTVNKLGGFSGNGGFGGSNFGGGINNGYGPGSGSGGTNRGGNGNGATNRSGNRGDGGPGNRG